MIVNGYQDFLSKFGGDNISAIDPLRNCQAVLQKICSCQKQRKSNKSEECNRIYINIVSSVIVNMSDYLKTKTTDQEIIFYHNGCHEIKRVKLR